MSSPYKHHNTVKFLIGIAPSGGITFLSRRWGGRASYLELTKRCEFLDLIEDRDLITADRGFNIEEILAVLGASLIVPASTRRKIELRRKEVKVSRGISSV